MKTSIWLKIKRPLYFVTVAFMLASVVACGSKDKKSGVSNRLVRGSGHTGQVVDQNGNPVAVAWGAISHNGMDILRDFMYGVTDLGDNVSQSTTANTGIRFRVNRTTRSIEMLVWDEIAAQTDQAFFWSLRHVSGSGPVVTVEDDVGTVTFRGQVVGNEWSGYIEFQNRPEFGGAYGELGRFSISASQML